MTLFEKSEPFFIRGVFFGQLRFIRQDLTLLKDLSHFLSRGYFSDNCDLSDKTWLFLKNLSHFLKSCWRTNKFLKRLVVIFEETVKLQTKHARTFFFLSYNNDNILMFIRFPKITVNQKNTRKQHFLMISQKKSWQKKRNQFIQICKKKNQEMSF